ncbi:MAG: threonylcarbamoyl-AMP synthase, partial [Gordonia sp. (in: high G+C Gram-positive bacteria)]
MSTVYDCTDPQTRSAGMRAAVAAARSSRLVVLPTDTLYGLGCDAFDSEAVADLLAAKGR